MSNADAIPSFKDCTEWSEKIAEYWDTLGINLDVPDDHITNININTQLYPSHEKRAYKMLKTWIEQGGASYRKMAGALIKLGKVKLANSICPSMDYDEHGQANGHQAADPVAREALDIVDGALKSYDDMSGNDK